MTGLDTNVVVRFFVEDDPIQYRQVGLLFQSFSIQNPGFISIVALAEFIWVLRVRYRISKPDLVECLRRLTSSPVLVLETHEVVLESMDRFAAGTSDFADYLIERLGARAGCGETMTFDRASVKSAGMRLLR